MLFYVINQDGGNMRTQNLKFLISIVIGVLIYIGLLLLQFSTQERTIPFVGVTILLFVTSLLIGFFIQKIQSRQEFQEQLRSKAIGAIRRLNDIEILVKRGLANISDGTHNNSSTMFNIINDSVRSAIFDWTDVLEEDFKKIQEIEEKKLALVTALNQKSTFREEDRKQIEELRKEIMRLRKSIPLNLSPPLSRELFSEMEAYQTQEMLNILAANRNEYEIRVEILDPKLNSLVEQGKPINFHYSYADGKSCLFVVSGNDIENPIGKVINRFTEEVIFDTTYYDWLSTALYKYRNNELIVLDEYTCQIDFSKQDDEILIKIPTSKLFYVHR